MEIDRNEKGKLWSLFDNFSKEERNAVSTGLNRSLNSDVLLVDGL
jgi:hypothetical protein